MAEGLIAASGLLELDGSCVIRRLAVAETILGTDMAGEPRMLVKGLGA